MAIGKSGMKIFLICPVRNASEDQKQQMSDYISALEQGGSSVYYPTRDTDQSDSIGHRICTDNLRGISEADEVHVFYDPSSSGSHFDLGMAFALGKPLKIVNPVSPTDGRKSFSNMILHWAGRVEA